MSLVGSSGGFMDCLVGEICDASCLLFVWLCSCMCLVKSLLICLVDSLDDCCALSSCFFGDCLGDVFDEFVGKFCLF